MYVCEMCGAIFEEPSRFPAGHFMFNPTVTEECPECGSEYFEEVIEYDDEQEDDE